MYSGVSLTPEAAQPNGRTLGAEWVPTSSPAPSFLQVHPTCLHKPQPLPPPCSPTFYGDGPCSHDSTPMVAADWPVGRHDPIRVLLWDFS